MANYILFNKPFEVLSQFTDQKGRSTLKEYIPVKGVYAAGRLDYRSEGLMFLSDDGPLIHRMTSPGYEHPKTYFAKVEGVATPEAVASLNQEILLPGLQTRQALAEIVGDPGFPPRPTPVRDYHPTTWLRIVLYEGKKHQVRRMTAKVGYPTLRLVRYAIGDLTLEGLSPGEWRPLSAAERNELRHEMGYDGL